LWASSRRDRPAVAAWSRRSGGGAAAGYFADVSGLAAGVEGAGLAEALSLLLGAFGSDFVFDFASDFASDADSEAGELLFGA